MPYSGFAAGDHTMTIRLKHVDGNGVAKSDISVHNVTYTTPKYFGGYATNLASPTATLLDSLASQDTNWNTSKGQSFTGNANTNTGYMYIAYPAYYGALTSLQTSAAPGIQQVLGVTQISSNFAYTVNGRTMNFRVYKSYNAGICTPGTTVTIG